MVKELEVPFVPDPVIFALDPVIFALRTTGQSDSDLSSVFSRGAKTVPDPVFHINVSEYYVRPLNTQIAFEQTETVPDPVFGRLGFYSVLIHREAR